MHTMREYPFPVAVHSYFALINHLTEKQAFIRGEIENPTFEYRSGKDKRDVQAYQKRVAAEDENIVHGLELVLISLALRQDDTAFEMFREANRTRYCAPSPRYTQAILAHYGSLAVDQQAKSLWAEVQTMLKWTIPAKPVDVGPSPETFAWYKGYLNRYIAPLPMGVSHTQAIQLQLDALGLVDKGWRLRLLPGSQHARTNHRTRTILMGKDYSSRNLTAARRIAYHEVIGHALRGPQNSLVESEGVAIMLEQLTDPWFRMRRSYRYLAVALGWGVSGTPMTFRGVYEVLWRLMVIGSSRSEEAAKSYAYDECCRAFRGGRPDIAGAVFLKDATYFDANIRVWGVLTESKLTYNEFVDVIEGRRTILV